MDFASNPFSIATAGVALRAAQKGVVPPNPNARILFLHHVFQKSDICRN